MITHETRLVLCKCNQRALLTSNTAVDSYVCPCCRLALDGEVNPHEQTRRPSLMQRFKGTITKVLGAILLLASVAQAQQHAVLICGQQGAQGQIDFELSDPEHGAQTIALFLRGGDAPSAAIGGDYLASEWKQYGLMLADGRWLFAAYRPDGAPVPAEGLVVVIAGCDWQVVDALLDGPGFSIGTPATHGVEVDGAGGCFPQLGIAIRPVTWSVVRGLYR